MEALFENPIVLIIIIWVISALFRKETKTKPKPETKKGHVRTVPQLRPPVIQSDSARNDRNIQKRHTARRPQQEPAMAQSELKQQLIENQKRRREHVNSRTEHKLPHQPSENMREQDSILTESSEGKQLVLDQNRLIDGLIFSEILGQPRAKRLHPSMKKLQGKQ